MEMNINYLISHFQQEGKTIMTCIKTVLPLMMVIICSFMIGHAFSNPNQQVTRYGWIIGIKPEMIPEYKRLHANPWPGVTNMIRDCNIRNYSIYLKEVEPGKYYLFSYLEYYGTDWEGDMAKMAADPVTQEWWKHTDPCQIPIPTRSEGENWADMEEVFHQD